MWLVLCGECLREYVIILVFTRGLYIRLCDLSSIPGDLNVTFTKDIVVPGPSLFVWINHNNWIIINDFTRICYEHLSVHKYLCQRCEWEHTLGHFKFSQYPNAWLTHFPSTIPDLSFQRLYPSVGMFFLYILDRRFLYNCIIVFQQTP